MKEKKNRNGSRYKTLARHFNSCSEKEIFIISKKNIAYTSHLTTICVSMYIIKVSFGNMSVKSQKYNAQHV